MTVLILIGVTVAVWLHNRNVLRDLFDYSTVITAAGKIEAGLKPYTDVRSPVQSSLYLLNYFTERAFGRHYLGLTWGGLVQALGGGLLLRALVRRELGPVRATVLAMAVVLAGLIQHLVFFYNPVGILCFSIVLLGLAVEPALWPVRSWRTVAICGALLLGGINKLNFQGITVGLSALVALGAASQGRLAARELWGNALMLAACGVVLPLAFELAWTGASLRLWFENVVLVPSARRELWADAFNPGIYLSPARDFHHHLLVRPISGFGLALLLVVGIGVLRRTRDRAGAGLERATCLLLLGAGILAGALIMITNNETVMLTSLAYPVLAVVFLLNFPAMDNPRGRGLDRLVFGALWVWIVAGGYAAWHGSRVLYGPNPPLRSAYVLAPTASPATAYFAGVRMLPEQIDANERAGAKLRAMEDSAGRLRGVLFGPGLEWMERAYPDTILQGAPISYNAGVSLNDSDAGYFEVLVDMGRRRLVAQRGWQSWTPTIQSMLGRRYREESVSSRDVMYHPRASGAPAAASAGLFNDVFRDAVAGNILVASTRTSEGLTLQSGSGDVLFGATEAATWSWPHGTYNAEGKVVARLQTGTIAAGTVVFRAIAGDPENGELLWELPLEIGPERPQVVLPVELLSGGRPLWLQTEMRPGVGPAAVAGWREMRITHSNEQDRTPPSPFGRGLLRSWPLAPEEIVDQVWFTRDGRPLSADGAAVVPAENWRRDTMQSGKLSVTVELTPDPALPGDHVVVTLAWYRGSRFEIMSEKEIDLRSTPVLTLQGYVPEPGGWVGLLTRTGSASPRVRVTAWSR